LNVNMILSLLEKFYGNLAKKGGGNAAPL